MKVLSFKLKDDLFLNHCSIAKTTPVALVPKRINHIFIIDRSGSMSWDLRQVLEDLGNRIKNIKKGDTVSIGYFSSEGRFDYFLKGFKLTEDADYPSLKQLLQKHSHTIGLTCFSEIIGATKDLIDTLTIFSDAFMLTFLSDGYPVVSNYKKEVSNIFENIAKIKNNIQNTLLVGYGDYYNKDLMAKMAKAFDGSLIHSSNFKDFDLAIENFINTNVIVTPKKEVDLSGPIVDMVFSLKKTQVTQYTPQVNKVYLPEDTQEEFWCTTNEVPRFANQKSVEIYDFEKQEDFNASNLLFSSGIFLRGMYSYAALQSQQNKPALALELMGCIGDVYFIDRITNAYTNAEYGDIEKELLAAATNRSMQYQQGQNRSYLPKRDAFCLVDLLNILVNDDSVLWYPYNKNFEYKRISPLVKTKEEGPKFIPNKDQGFPFSKLTWNEKLLNLSVLTKIQGDVKFETPSLGLGETYPSFTYRNYTLVKDGIPNVAKLPIQCTKETLKKLPIKYEIEKDTGIVILDLLSIPVMNRAMTDLPSITDVAKAQIQIEHLKAEIKVYKYLKDQIIAKVDEAPIDPSLSPAQKQFLIDNYVTVKGFNPPKEKAEYVDFYMAKQFHISIKGFSSLPKVEEVTKKITAGKTLTASQAIMAKAIDMSKAAIAQYPSQDIYIIWLTENIARCQDTLKTIRNEMQKMKFGVILGKKWWKELDSYEDNKLNVDGYELTIGITEKKVNI